MTVVAAVRRRERRVIHQCKHETENSSTYKPVLLPDHFFFLKSQRHITRISDPPASEHDEGVMICIFPNMLSLKLYQEITFPLHNPHPLDISFIVVKVIIKFHIFIRLSVPSNAWSDSKLPPLNRTIQRKRLKKLPQGLRILKEIA